MVRTAAGGGPGKLVASPLCGFASPLCGSRCAVLYRPFCKLHLFFDRILNEEVYAFPRIFPTPETERENRVIVISDIGYRAFSFAVLMANCITNLHLCASSDSHQCFPFFVYDEHGGNRRENITDWVLGRFRERYDDPAITKWDIFHYVYGVLHHPAYRQKFGDNLKRELPRIPFMADFRAISEAGRRLAELHVGYETVEPWPLRWVYSESTPLPYRVEKMRLNKDKSALMVNESLTLADIPPEAFEYRLGNRSALGGSSTSIRLRRTSGAGSPPTRTVPTTRNTSSDLWSVSCASASRRFASSRGCLPADSLGIRGGHGAPESAGGSFFAFSERARCEC